MDIQILQKQISLFGEDQLMLSQEDSLVKTQVKQNNGEKVKKGLQEKEQRYGGKWRGQLKKSDQNGLSQKMFPIFCELTTEEILLKFSINWPQWGTMQNGKLCTLQTSVRHTKEQDVTWLLTPTASDYLRTNLSSPMYSRRLHRSAGSLPERLYRLGNRGLLNHQFVAWIMGFPIDHLKCMANLD